MCGRRQTVPAYPAAAKRSPCVTSLNKFSGYLRLFEAGTRREWEGSTAVSPVRSRPDRLPVTVRIGAYSDTYWT